MVGSYLVVALDVELDLLAAECSDPVGRIGLAKRMMAGFGGVGAYLINILMCVVGGGYSGESERRKVREGGRW